MTSKICDVCGQDALGRVQVSIISDNVIIVDCPTGTALEKDLCANCRKSTVTALFADCLALHEAAIVNG